MANVKTGYFGVMSQSANTTDHSDIMFGRDNAGPASSAYLAGRPDTGTTYAPINYWALATRRAMHDLTPLGADAKVYRPGTGAAALFIRGFVHTDYHPGTYNSETIWTFGLFFDVENATHNLQITGWLDTLRLTSPVDGPNAFEATVRCSGDITYGEGWT